LWSNLQLPAKHNTADPQGSTFGNEGYGIKTWPTTWKFCLGDQNASQSFLDVGEKKHGTKKTDAFKFKEIYWQVGICFMFLGVIWAWNLNLGLEIGDGR